MARKERRRAVGFMAGKFPSVQFPVFREEIGETREQREMELGYPSFRIGQSSPKGATHLHT
jgi:hypothetical protein